MINFGIESASVVYTKEKQALIFGGWGDDERMDKVFKFEIMDAIDQNGNFKNANFRQIA